MRRFCEEVLCGGSVRGSVLAFFRERPTRKASVLEESVRRRTFANAPLAECQLTLSLSLAPFFLLLRCFLFSPPVGYFIGMYGNAAFCNAVGSVWKTVEPRVSKLVVGEL